MRICFTSDFHGGETLYEQLEVLLAAERPDLVILGGDMFPDGDIDDPSGTQGRYAQQVFIPRVEKWRAAWPAMTVACILGNHDWRCTQHALHTYHEQELLVMLDHRTRWTLRGVEFLGYSCTPPTPYWVKDFERLDLADDAIPETGGVVWDLRALRARQAEPGEHFKSRPDIARDLAASAATGNPWILVSHAPPYQTTLDRLPHIDHPIGSRAVRAFIEARRPLCSLHGHFHESPSVTGAYCDKVGETLAINPGQTTVRLHAVVFDSDNPRGTLRHTVHG